MKGLSLSLKSKQLEMRLHAFVALQAENVMLIHLPRLTESELAGT